MELLLCSHSLSLRSFSMTPLRRRMLEDMQIRNLSAGIQAIYLAQVSQFARYFGKPPDVLGEQEIRAYQLHLTQEKKLAPSTSPSLYPLCGASTKSPSAAGGTSKTSSLPPKLPTNCRSFSAPRKYRSSWSVCLRANTGHCSPLVMLPACASPKPFTSPSPPPIVAPWSCGWSRARATKTAM